jgi:D-alanyl-D-alanine carboxypeptidase
MLEFINTADVIGDEEMFAQIIQRTVTQYQENRISKIGANAFCDCTALTVVDVPEVTKIDANAFGGCTALEALILRSNTVVTMANANALGNSGIAKGTGFVYVPSALVDSYKAATNWSTYASQFRAIEDYPDICGG